MFYSQDILQKRGGRFGIIWIAATSSKSLSRRDYSSVNVVKTCDDILDFVLLRAKPKYPGGARPRLSLYLSSQLMYGLAKVYSKQREYLFMDVSSMSTKCRAITVPMGDIDLKAFSRQDLVTNPDYATLSSRDGPSFDPTFGVFNADDLLRFDIIPEMEMWKIQPSPEILLSPLESPARSEISARSFRPVLGSPHTVSSSEITMVEELEPENQVPPAEEELPMLNGDELQMLIDDQALDEPLLQMMMSPTQAISTPIQSQLTKTLHHGKVLPALEETPIAEIQASSLIEPPARVRRGPPPSPGITPQVIEKRPPKRKRESLAMELSPNVTPSPRRRRKRRLLFTDRETQIGKSVLKNNMISGKGTCREFELPEVGAQTVANLFSKPARTELRHPSLVRLWERNLFAMPYSEADSDKEHPIWTVPDLSVERSSASEEEIRQVMEEAAQEQATQDITGMSIELEREVSVTMERSRQLDDTPLAINVERELQESREGIHLSHTEDQPSIKRPKVSVGTSSEDELIDFQDQLELEQPDLSRGLSRLGEQLYSVPELQEEEAQIPMLAEESRQKITDVEEELIRSISVQTSVENWTTFKGICPLHTLRPKVAVVFNKILEFCAAQKLKCKQKQPYGDIYISRGRHW